MEGSVCIISNIDINVEDAKCKPDPNIEVLVVVYWVWHPNCDWPGNLLLLKNPQFLPDHYETWTK